MGSTVTLIVVVLVVLVLLWFMYRSIQRQVKKVLSGERSLDDRDIWLRHEAPTPARVLSRKETTRPEAAGIAKVDLELEILVPDGSPVRASTCWLVEIPNLSLLEPGCTVEVKFDPKRPDRVFPAVSWARLWLFGK